MWDEFGFDPAQKGIKNFFRRGVNDITTRNGHGYFFPKLPAGFDCLPIQKVNSFFPICEILPRCRETKVQDRVLN